MHCFIYRYTVCNILLYCNVPRTMHAIMQNIYCFPLFYNCTKLFSRHVLCFANMFCVLLTYNMFCVLTKCFIIQNLLYNIVVQHCCTTILYDFVASVTWPLNDAPASLKNIYQKQINLNVMHFKANSYFVRARARRPSPAPAHWWQWKIPNQTDFDFASKNECASTVLYCT